MRAIRLRAARERSPNVVPPPARLYGQRPRTVVNTPRSGPCSQPLNGAAQPHAHRRAAAPHTPRGVLILQTRHRPISDDFLCWRFCSYSYQRRAVPPLGRPLLFCHRRPNLATRVCNYNTAHPKGGALTVAVGNKVVRWQWKPKLCHPQNPRGLDRISDLEFIQNGAVIGRPARVIGGLPPRLTLERRARCESPWKPSAANGVMPVPALARVAATAPDGIGCGRQVRPDLTHST